MSKFNSQGEFVYLESETRESQKGHPYTMVTLGDQLALQRLRLFKGDELDISNLSTGDKVMATIALEMNGFKVNTNLVSLTPVK